MRNWLLGIRAFNVQDLNFRAGNQPYYFTRSETMFTFPFLLTLYAGFTHAFEADHLLAVSNIVTRRNSIKLSLKDGIFWGLGHASTIFFIAVLMILFKIAISAQYFHYFEATVGLMLIILAVYRLVKCYRSKTIVVHAHTHKHNCEEHKHLHVHFGKEHKHQHAHSLAYGVGLVHGLAGSGALIVVVMSQMKGPFDGLTYLFLFGTSCIAGMMLAAGLFSIPFSKKVMRARSLQFFLIMASSALCLWFGTKVIYENLMVNF
jgi:ABC-type nickel/cobalt efflux system permease component RcnA